MARLDTGTRACVALGFALAWGAAGCAEDAGIRAGPNSSTDAAIDASRDAAERDKQRSVSIFVPEIVHREFVAGADGSFAYGEVTAIDGAEVCVKLQRSAFQSFAAFDALSKPICATTKAGEVVILEVPANSDLVIMIEKQGFLPASATARTDDRDLPVPARLPRRARARRPRGDDSARLGSGACAPAPKDGSDGKLSPAYTTRTG